MKEKKIVVASAEDMQSFASDLAATIQSPAIIFLEGDLGAGKTTFVRGFLRHFNYTDKVKSPTFTLVEPYELPQQLIFHYDFYRISDPNELLAMGILDYFQLPAIHLIEWPSHVSSQLPSPDLTCKIEFAPQGRILLLS